MQIILMIICICRRINENAVREAVSAGARCPDSVQAHHGNCFNCGKCRLAIGEIIASSVDSALDQSAPAQMLAAE